MNLQRFVEAGAVWAWPTGQLPLHEARHFYTVIGNPTPGHGRYGPHLTFGGSDYVTLTAAEEVLTRFDSGTQDFSIVAWVRRAVVGAWHVIIDKADANNDGWLFGFRNNDFPLMKVNAKTGFGPPIIDTLWHNVIATIDRSGNILVYSDGVPGTGVASGVEVMATTINPCIGAVAVDQTLKFNGDIAGIFIADRAYTEAECIAIATGKAF